MELGYSYQRCHARTSEVPGSDNWSYGFPSQYVSCHFSCFLSNFLTVLLGGAGALGYLTFGKDIEAVVLVNLDRSSKMVQGVRSPSSLVNVKFFLTVYFLI